MNYNIREQLEALQKKYFTAIDEAFKAKTVLGEKYFEEMRKDLFDRYIIEREQLKETAKIPDKNIDYATKLQIYELTPHNRGFLWLFKNEAKKLKIREISVEDRIELDARTANVETLEDKIYFEPEEEQPKKLSFFKRFFKHKRAEDNSSPVAAEQEAPEQQQPVVVQGNAQSDNAAASTLAEADEPPIDTPSTEKPKSKRKAKSKNIIKPTEEQSTPQLQGQIAIDELGNK